MERLYPTLAAINRAVDHIIVQNYFVSFYMFMLVLAVGGVFALLHGIQRQGAASLTDTKDWASLHGMKFTIHPNGKVEVVSSDGLNMLRSTKSLKLALVKRLKTLGLQIDHSDLDAIIEREASRIKDPKLGTQTTI
ncbi:hypothetical protein [Tardiphaga sp. P9-11]|uniref:hypothetical protein n=1 Tax=Tardiphaga sp. P9-11 TaxID=2024614 RepID=UPI0011F2AAF6|nr:hypothetical protein [Tardiphaga sp. P9-11]